MFLAFSRNFAERISLESSIVEANDARFAIQMSFWHPEPWHSELSESSLSLKFDMKSLDFAGNAKNEILPKCLGLHVILLSWIAILTAQEIPLRKLARSCSKLISTQSREGGQSRADLARQWRFHRKRPQEPQRGGDAISWPS